MNLFENQKQVLDHFQNTYGPFQIQEEFEQGKYGKRISINNSFIKGSQNIRHRKIFSREMIFETDLPEPKENKQIAEDIIKTLVKNKFKFSAWDSGNKSIHIHIFFDKQFEKELTTSEQRTKAKDLFAQELSKGVSGLYEKLDKNKFNENTMIRLEYSTHLKTGRQKEPAYFPISYKENKMFEEIIKQAKQKKVFPKATNIKPNKCPFLDYALTNKLPEGNRNNVLFPNAVAMLSEEQLNQLEETQQDKIGWRNKKTSFNCQQLREYAKQIGKETICINHLIGGSLNG